MHTRYWLGLIVALTMFSLGMAVLLAPPARAAEACAYTLDVTIPQLKADPTVREFVVIDDPEFVAKLTAALRDKGEAIPDNVTRVLVAQIVGSDGEARVKYGLEYGGCLAPGKLWPLESPFPAVEHLSGGTALGVFA